jgi:hypothetical protein
MAEVDAPSATPATTVLANAAKLVGEIAVVPGVSLAVDGDVKSGALHAAAAIAGALVLGPFLGTAAWIASGLDSYSKSVTGRHLHQLLGKKAA